jgi:glutaredoxin
MKEACLKTVPQIFAHDGNYVGGYRELELVLGLANNREY